MRGYWVEMRSSYGIRRSAPLLFIQHLTSVASLCEACGRSWLALSLPLPRETILFCHVLSITLVIGYQLGMCALLFYNSPPPHSTPLSVCVCVCLDWLPCARTYNSAVHPIPSRYGPDYPRLHSTITNAVPISRQSSRTFFYARTIRTRLVLDSLLPPHPLLLPLFSLSLLSDYPTRSR